MSGRLRAALAWTGRALALLAAWAVAFVLAIVAYDLAWSPSIRRREAPVAAEVERLGSEVRSFEVVANQLTKFDAQGAELQRQVEDLRLLLPEATDAGAVERAIGALAAQSGVTVVRFTTGEPRRFQHYARLPVEAELRGPLPGLLELPRRIEASSSRVFVPPLRAPSSTRYLPDEATGLIQVRGVHVEREGGTYRARLRGFAYSGLAQGEPR